jgi:cytochrome c-type biogenesis protein
MGLALAAGILAAVNPCGFAMLPAYISLLVMESEQGRLRRALALTSGMTLGFVTVFGIFGLLAAPAAGWIGQRLPWLTVVIGSTLVILGVWLAFGKDIPSPVAKHPRAPDLNNRFGSMFLFGVSFALASLGCSIGPFLAVVASSFGSADGIMLFVAYAGGMALVVGTVAIAVALAQQPLIAWLKRRAALTQRLAGVLMALAGGYVAWYGWYAVRLDRDPLATDPLVSAMGAAQTWLAAGVERIGALWFAAALVALTAGLVLARTYRSKAR